MFITVNIYKNNQFKWQEQVLLDASTKAEAKQKAMLIPNSTRWAMDLTSISLGSYNLPNISTTIYRIFFVKYCYFINFQHFAAVKKVKYDLSWRVAGDNLSIRKKP